jgi:hypothetical protein
VLSRPTAASTERHQRRCYLDSIVRWCGVGILAALIALVVVASAGAGPTAAAPRVKKTNGFVQALAVGGGRVAYGVAASSSPSACARVAVWRPATRRVVRVSGKGTCREDPGSTGSGIRELAFGGTRVGWVFNSGGNSESTDHLYVSSTLKPRERRAGTAFRSGSVDCALEGRWLGGLAGDAQLLAYSVWTTTAPDQNSCREHVTSGSLRRVTSGGSGQITAGIDAVVSRAAAAGRIAVLRADGTVALYSNAGRLLRELPLDDVRAVALSGNNLIALLGQSLAVYGAGTGRLVRTLPVRRGALHLDAAEGFAVYAVGRTVRALRLKTGQDIRLAASRFDIADAAVGAGGVAYAYNTTTRSGNRFRDVGTIVFRPMSQVRAAFTR